MRQLFAKSTIVFGSLLLIFAPQFALADDAYTLNSPAPGFGPGQYQNLISDAVFTAPDLNQSDIESFLQHTGSWAGRSYAKNVSWLSNYQIPEYQTVPYKYKSGNDCIWDTIAVRQYNDITSEALYGQTVAALMAKKGHDKLINPAVLLATLQKESSAISNAAPDSDAVAMWVLGYGWNYTMASCGYNQSQAQARAVAYGGVGQQIAYAMSGLRGLYNTYSSSYATPFTTVDGATIVAANASTRALYAYTPYVYNGNYNFWNFFNQWFVPVNFSVTGLTRGSDGTVYVVVDNALWPVTGAGFNAWGFSWSNVTLLSDHPEWQSLPIKGTFSNLALADDGTIYAIDGGKKRPIPSARVFQRNNFNWSDVQALPSSLLERVPFGLPMYELVLPNGDGTVYLTTAGTRYAVSGDIFNNAWAFTFTETAKVPAYAVARYPVGQLLTRLAVADGGDGTVFLMDRGYGYKVSAAVAKAWNLDLSQIRTVGPTMLDERGAGGMLTTLVKQDAGDGTIYLVQNGTKRPIARSYWLANRLSFDDVRSISASLINTLATGSTLR